MSDQPPFQPPNQPPYQPPYQPAQPQPSYDAPTQVPGQGWAQQPPSAYPQQPPAQPPYQQGYPSPGGTPPGGGPKKTPWGLVIGALVAGLIIGGGAAAGIVAATAGDPKDSDEYKALSNDLDEAEASLEAQGGEPTAESPTESESAEPIEPEVPTATESSASPEAPEPSGDTREVDGWTITEPEITEDSLGDFQAVMQVTNGTGGPEVGYFEVTVSKGSKELTQMTCINEDGAEIPNGESAEVSCFTSDDYTDDYDKVDIQAGF